MSIVPTKSQERSFIFSCRNLNEPIVKDKKAKINSLHESLKYDNALSPEPARARHWSNLGSTPYSRPPVAIKTPYSSTIYSIEATPSPLLKSPVNNDFDDKVYDALVHSSYIKLALTLKTKQGYPWNEIKRLSSPILMEQLTQIYEIAKGHKINLNLLMNFCLNYARIGKSSTFSINKGSDATTLLLGKILFLLNLDVAQTADLLNDLNIVKVIENVNNCTNGQLEKMFCNLSTHQFQHVSQGLQDAQLAYISRMPYELANCLLLKTGEINVGFIPVIKDHFSDKKKRTSFENHFLYVLNAFESSPLLRSLLSTIEAPYASPRSEDLIRISLRLPNNHPITSLEARKAALMALLSHLRQGPAGSCFATFICIEMLSSNLVRCLSDISELLSYGKITRIVNGHKVEFTFLMKVSSGSIDKTIHINKDGSYLKNSSMKIYESIGLIDACRSVGIVDITSVARLAIHEMYNSGENVNQTNISIKKFMELMILQARKMKLIQSEESVHTLLDKATLAYESQLQNVVLRIWENAVANTAEIRDTSLLKQSFCQAVTTSITKYSKALVKCYHDAHPFIAELSKMLLQRIHFTYDPSVIYQEMASDKHSTKGAFILYDTKNADNPKEWKLIQNSSDFQIFVGSVVRQVISPLDVYENDDLLVDSTRILIYLQSHDFLQHAIKEYNFANAKKAHLGVNVEAANHVPWLVITGDDPKEVLQIYHEKFTDTFTEFVSTPKTASDLLKDLIGFAKKGVPQEHIFNPAYKQPLIVDGLHACSLLINHPTFKRAWNSTLDPADWIKMNITDYGQHISKFFVGSEARSQIINKLSQKIPEIKRKDFIAEANQLSSILLLPEYRNKMIELTLKFLSPQKYDAIYNDLDKFIYNKAFSEGIRFFIHDLEIHFADSNWQHGMQSSNFSFIFNPATANVELWETLENGDLVSPLDPETWIKDKKWVYIPDPLAH